jgi:outer membrane protein assembly factor BamB
MTRERSRAALSLVVLAFAACAARAPRPLIDPFPLRFPLVEAGTLEIEGRVVGQPKAHGDVVYYLTRQGDLTAVGVPSRAVLWRFKADHTVSSSPEIHGDIVLFHDDGGVLYGVVKPGRALLKKAFAPAVATPARVLAGGLVFGTADGTIRVSEVNGDHAQEHRLPGPEAGITAGPVPVWDKEGFLARTLFGRSDGRLQALGQAGTPQWEFKARGAIPADPAQLGDRVFFGTDARMFYCLDAATGKSRWRRRLQGAPVHPAVVSGGTVVVAASNSVVYFLSARGGSILSWEPVPSRVAYPPVPAGPLVLVSSASQDVAALDIKTQKRIGRYQASGPLAAGAVWSPPHVVLFVEDPGSGRHRIVFLRSR